jgi:hypothetical protein
MPTYLHAYETNAIFTKQRLRSLETRATEKIHLPFTVESIYKSLSFLAALVQRIMGTRGLMFAAERAAEVENRERGRERKGSSWLGELTRDVTATLVIVLLSLTPTCPKLSLAVWTNIQV